jgi:hypothetical protein
MSSRTASVWQKCISIIKSISVIVLKLNIMWVFKVTEKQIHWCIDFVSAKSYIIVFNKIIM